MSDEDKQQDQPQDPRGGYHSGPFPEQAALITTASIQAFNPSPGIDYAMTKAAQVAFTAAYVLLASDQGSYVSGAVLPATGGRGL